MQSKKARTGENDKIENGTSTASDPAKNNDDELNDDDKNATSAMGRTPRSETEKTPKSGTLATRSRNGIPSHPRGAGRLPLGILPGRGTTERSEYHAMRGKGADAPEPKRARQGEIKLSTPLPNLCISAKCRPANLKTFPSPYGAKWAHNPG